MNRQQRRALAKQQRKWAKKMALAEKKVGADMATVSTIAVQIQDIQTTLETLQQAIHEIPFEELNQQKMLEDVEDCRTKMLEIRAKASSMGPAVKGALDEAVSKSEEAADAIGKALMGIEDE